MFSSTDVIYFGFSVIGYFIITILFLWFIFKLFIIFKSKPIDEEDVNIKEINKDEFIIKNNDDEILNKII